MLGTLRFSLALLVSLNHLWFIYGVGRLAVFSFYVISGYLMTTIIRETYGLSLRGVRRYAENRLLRIYPAYLLSFFIFSIVFSYFNRDSLIAFDGNISTPATAIDWLRNITLVGLDFWVKDRTIPPSWTLYVELSYYALIPALLFLGNRALLVWLGISCAFHAYLLLGAGTGDPSLAWEQRYGSVAAGSVGFAIGACARVYLPTWLQNRPAFLGSLLIFCGCYAYSAYWALTGTQPGHTRYLSTIAYYAVMLSAAPVVDYLARMPKHWLSEKLGEFSYPYYLLHLPVGFLAFVLVGSGHKTWQTLFAGIVASLLASWILVKIDQKISRARRVIRDKARLNSSIS